MTGWEQDHPGTVLYCTDGPNQDRHDDAEEEAPVSSTASSTGLPPDPALPAPPPTSTSSLTSPLTSTSVSSRPPSTTETAPTPKPRANRKQGPYYLKCTCACTSSSVHRVSSTPRWVAFSPGDAVTTVGNETLRHRDRSRKGVATLEQKVRSDSLVDDFERFLLSYLLCVLLVSQPPCCCVARLGKDQRAPEATTRTQTTRPAKEDPHG